MMQLLADALTQDTSFVHRQLYTSYVIIRENGADKYPSELYRKYISIKDF